MLIKEVAAQQAQEVLETHWDGTFPVTPSRIAKSLGISIREASLTDGTSGVIMKRPNEDAQILIEKNDPPVRQRFTAAHEIGHFIERTVVQDSPDEDFGFVDRRNSKVHNAHEFFANEFASNLLMPADEVNRLRQLNFGEVRMAAHFGVSLVAMKTRLMKLERVK